MPKYLVRQEPPPLEGGDLGGRWWEEPEASGLDGLLVNGHDPGAAKRAAMRAATTERQRAEALGKKHD